jgi:hypothetical protein
LIVTPGQGASTATSLARPAVVGAGGGGAFACRVPMRPPLHMHVHVYSPRARARRRSLHFAAPVHAMHKQNVFASAPSSMDWSLMEMVVALSP